MILAVPLNAWDPCGLCLSKDVGQGHLYYCLQLTRGVQAPAYACNCLAFSLPDVESHPKLLPTPQFTWQAV